MIDFKAILKNFGIDICCNDMVQPYGDGHINDTYLVSTEPKYILQRINTTVFKDPVRLMNNIALVTEFLGNKIKENGGDPEVETLTIVKTVDGENFFEFEGNHYRVYLFINGVSYNLPNNELLYEAGKAFGKFQNQLADFNAELLFESIPNFHHTRKRFNTLKAAVEADKMGRANSVKDVIDFALSCEKYVDIVVDGIADKTIPLRVTHNDTKINNILFDKETNACLSVIDLDTVMPGSMLYDFGDALRFGASSAKEDETNLDAVFCQLDKFEAFTKGFLGEVKASATAREIELLPLSVLLLTYECGIRFLTDYLEGDTYFKIHYPEHNIDRARNQLKLVADIETKLDEMSNIVKKYA
ncbi:MAG: aminoglycoside phosphotransferase family protein [Clostridiales bacterium]|nr:aminoglycoside phosphotransferase family protein [Clostridiales bacterium]